MIKKIFNRIRNSSVKAKLLMSFTFLSLANSTFIFIYFPLKFEKTELESFREKANAIARVSSYNLAPALYFSDRADIDNMLSALRHNDDLLFILIFDSKDKIVSGFNIIEGKKYFESKLKNQDVSEDASVMNTGLPILYNNKSIGSVFLGMSLKDMNEAANEERASIALFSALLFVISMTFIYFVSIFFTRPLKKMVTVFEKVAEGDLSGRVEIANTQEFSLLSISFNKMIVKLENAYHDLRNEIEINKSIAEELRQVQQELFVALESEKELNIMKTNFISMISHEYRTPLTIILSSSYLLNIFFQKNQTSEFEKQIHKIQSSVKDLIVLLEDVLTLGKFDARKMKVNPNEIDLIEVINENILQSQVLDSHNHHYKFEKSLDNLKIISDKKLLNHILSNLFSNAAKYSAPDTDIIVKLWVDTKIFEIQVLDSGIGIPSESIKLIFEPFLRGSNVGAINGTGLGLTIVKKTVEALKGKVQIESLLGKGTKITVSLPTKY